MKKLYCAAVFYKAKKIIVAAPGFLPRLSIFFLNNGNDICGKEGYSMMNTFQIIHLILGIWLAIVNFSPVMSSTTLVWNNVIIGVIVAVYNAYYLFARKDVDVHQS